MHIIHVITGLGDGGAEGVLYRLCVADAQNTHHVVSLMGDGKYGALLRDAGVRVTSLDMPRGRVTLGGLSRLRSVFRASPEAVVQTWMYHSDLIGGIVARLSGNSRVVWNIRHTRLDPLVTPRSTRIIARLAGMLSGLVPRSIVLCAEAARESHIEYGYTSRRMVVIQNGYDVARLADATAASDVLAVRQALERSDVPLLGMVGRFSPQKDHLNLLQALRRLASSGVPFHCLLVGSGMDLSNDELASWIDDHDLRGTITLLGARSDIPGVMKALDLHVLASNDEGFPNVVAEAMACGTPCATTDVGDAALIVDGLGWIAPARSPALLSAAIGTALIEWRNDPSSWAERKYAAASRIKDEFSLEAMVERYRAVWVSVAGK